MLFRSVTANNMVIKITPSAVTTTLAGSPTSGNVDGVGTAASFNNPVGICIDASGNIYVADKGNFKIRKITPSGVVSTFAGSGVTGTVNATGSAASFQNPTGICISPSGDLYVTDQMNFSLPYPWNPKVRKIDAGQVVTDFCYLNGNCHGLAAVSNSLFIVQPNTGIGSNSIHYCSTSAATGTISLYAGSSSGTGGMADGPLLSALFGGPIGITKTPSGDLLVADNGNHRIRLVSATTVTTVAGNGGIACVDGPVATANFWGPNSLAIASNGDIYVGDNLCKSVRKITGLNLQVGIKENMKFNENFYMYPNPANEKITISLENVDKTTKCKIINLVGNVVGEFTTQSLVNDIDISMLPSGIYFLNVNESTTRKFIKY